MSASSSVHTTPLDLPCPSATDGEIAAVNLESARRRAWARFVPDPRLPAAAEAVIDKERLAAQFLGDLDALDRLEVASQLAGVDDSSRAALVQAEVASTQLGDSRSGFEELLGRHLLAFADHAAEFYAGSGDDHQRALECARTNVANRPTRRAVEQMDAIALKAAATSNPHDSPTMLSGTMSARRGSGALI
jgi:hypothetical protein